LGALVAAVHKNGKNVAPLAVNMLCELRHRGTDAHGIATPTKTKTAPTFDKLDSDINSPVVLGHNFSQIMTRDHVQPIQGNGFTLVFEGRLFPCPNRPGVSEAQEVAEKLAPNPLTKAYSLIENLEGSYVFAIAQNDRVIAGRDMFGETPLYYGENESVCALASERKALWKIGITDPQPFPPGQLATVDSTGFNFRAAKTLNNPPTTPVDMETASEALQLLLLDSTRRRVCDLESVAVAFSGGVDSTVVAALAKTVGLDVQLIAVGLEKQPEVMFAKQAAEALELPIHIQTYSMGALEATLAEALWLTEENHPVNACIAVPFYWLAETASKLGHPVLLAGQGADELFGGYQRYVTEYLKSGAQAVEKTMFHDVQNAYSANFQRDNQVCAYQKVELRLPFIDRKVVDFALRLPLRLKLKTENDQLRKRILRRTARDLDIPSFLADKPKKAVQYTTGVTKALQRLAKKQNLTLREYVNKIYNKAHSSRNVIY